MQRNSKRKFNDYVIIGVAVIVIFLSLFVAFGFAQRAPAAPQQPPDAWVMDYRSATMPFSCTWHTIQGRVMFKQGGMTQPLPGAVLEVRSKADGILLDIAVSDEDGEFVTTGPLGNPIEIYFTGLVQPQVAKKVWPHEP